MEAKTAMAGPDGRLIVGIVSDEAVLKKKGNAPILSFSERLELASAIKYADVVVGQQNYTPYENIEMLKFSVRGDFPSIIHPIFSTTTNHGNSLSGVFGDGATVSDFANEFLRVGFDRGDPILALIGISDGFD